MYYWKKHFCGIIFVKPKQVLTKNILLFCISSHNFLVQVPVQYGFTVWTSTGVNGQLKTMEAKHEIYIHSRIKNKQKTNEQKQKKTIQNKINRKKTLHKLRVF